MKLLPSQKNEVFDLIENSGLSPSLFEIIDASSMKDGKTIIKFKNSPYHCSFYLHHDRHNIIVTNSPDENLYERDMWVKTEWSSLKLVISDWLRVLYREINETDKWERLKQEILQITIVDDNETDKFSAYEYEQLKTKMGQVKIEFRNIQLPPDQLVVLEQKIDHLTELALNLNKFDWKSLFAGTIAGIIVQLAFTPENAKAIWNAIKAVFNKYFLP